ncbi:glycosyltransferase family 4 protein [Empedobacter falsenii]
MIEGILLTMSIIKDYINKDVKTMILHITNDYSGSTVYKNLVEELDNLGLSQIVYNPIKEKSRIGKNKIDLEVNDSDIIYSHILNKTSDRVFYRKKIKKILKDIETKIDFSKIKMIHAHTWYSDGGVAYLLSKKYNIPYIVTIRNSDLNVFQKYLIHERSFGRKILEKAKNIILIAASYNQRVLSESSLQKIKAQLEIKLKIIPNGVDSFWINSAVEKKIKTDKKVFNLLFIGKFTEGKNVVPLQLAVNELNKEKNIVHLHLIGGGGNAHQKVLDQLDLNKNTMTYHGKIFDMSKLKEHFESADIFVMPSKHETFGLVYVEAMLQGLPILYTANEGIDGFYDEKIGEKVCNSTVDEIKIKLFNLIEDYNSYNIPTEKLKKNHNWKNIALVYQQLYNVK